jgi:hypothetical protein
MSANQPEKKTTAIGCAATKTELAAFKTLAQSQGLTVSQMLRRILREYFNARGIAMPDIDKENTL